MLLLKYFNFQSLYNIISTIDRMNDHPRDRDHRDDRSWNRGGFDDRDRGGFGDRRRGGGFGDRNRGGFGDRNRGGGGFGNRDRRRPY